MTIAVCKRCGSFKHGAITPCTSCGWTPSTQQDIAESIALSDHHYHRSQLELFSQQIKDGGKPRINPSIASDYQDALSTKAGAAMAQMLRNLTRGTSSGSWGDPVTDNSFRLSWGLLGVEAASPGSLTMRVNPFLIDQIVSVFRSELRLRKPFLTSSDAFVKRCATQNQSALHRLLPSSLLAGPTDDQGLVLCWSGQGRFAGKQGLFQLPDFTSGAKDKVTVIFNINPFFNSIQEMLERPK